MSSSTILKYAALILLLVVALLFAWQVLQLLLMVFAGILLAILLRAIACWIAGRTKLSSSWGLAITLIGLLVVMGGALWLTAPRLVAEAERLGDQIPQAIDQLQAALEGNPLGRNVLASIESATEELGGSATFSRAAGYAATILDLLVGILVVLFTGIYLAAGPDRYRRGLVRLFPQERRHRVQEILDVLHTLLQRWIMGRMLLMFVNGGLTTIGLAILDIPLAFILGVIAGVLNFVPNFGPIVAAVPAILIAAAKDPISGAYVALLYLVLQMLDGYVLTPLVQQRAVDVPPALIIVFQVALGTLAGTMGLLLANPLMAAIFVIVKLSYVEDVLGEEVEVQHTS